ncbi:hypothetical protein D3C71_1755570 [compost metagenome]
MFAPCRYEATHVGDREYRSHGIVMNRLAVIHSLEKLLHVVADVANIILNPTLFQVNWIVMCEVSD